MYEVYLDGVQLPITPGKLQIKVGGNNKTINLIDQGEVNILKDPALTEVAFDMLLSDREYPFSASSSSITDWLDRLEALKTERKQFRFIVTRTGGLDTNLGVSLEEYTVKEDAGSYGSDVLVSVKLKQYRPYGTKTVVISEQQTATVYEQRAESSAKEATPASHTVVSGDTLWALCKKYLGDGNRYPEIAALNGISNPHLIYPGQVIRFG